MINSNLVKHFHSSFTERFVKLCIVFLLLLQYEANAQFLHTQGKQIVNGNNEEIILRGMGLGGWMLQEGYMLETNGFANPQHQIRAKIEDMIGKTNTDAFYEAWLANHCTRRDIDSLASWGFNSVRLPMHYNLFTLPIEKEPVAGQQTWLDKGFVMTDSLLKWCAANKIYLILDLHAAPGGQGKDAAISDYDNSKPSLWESQANQDKTIALWKKLAERYKNEVWIGGYDLINETNWNYTPGANQNGCDEKVNAPLRKLLGDITTAIRTVDQNHIIFIEGNCWANNYSGILPTWDNNMVVSFHKYWNYNDQNSVQGMINIRNQYNVPLWLGESGENSNTWFTNAIRLMEDNKIGWAWWPLKKVNSVVNPLTVVKNPDYEQLLNYWKNGGTRPSFEFAKNALFKLADNLKIENCIYRKDVIDAMFRQVRDASTLPYKNHKVPGVVHASDFDLGRYNRAYADKDTATYQVSTGAYSAWNSGWSYRNDGVDIQPNTDSDTDANGYNIGWTNDKEWMLYTLQVDSTAAYQVSVRYTSSGNQSSIKLSVDGADRSSIVILPATSGWSSAIIPDVILYKGVQRLKFSFEKGGANFGYMKFSLSKKISEIPLSALSAETKDEQTLSVSFNKPVDASSITSNGFSITVNGATATIVEVKADPSGNTRLIIKIEKLLNDADNIKISYNADAIKSTDGTLLQDFTNLQVKNNLPFHIALPGLVEAENFTLNRGLQLENTTDTGGGQNIGYTNAGDYLEYLIKVAEESEYTVEARIACNSQAGKIEIQQLSRERSLLNSVTLDVPVTGGWQKWQTVSTKINLQMGTGILRVKIIQPEFNINWFKFSKLIVSGVKDNRQGSLKIYPNPVKGSLMVEMPEHGPHHNNRLQIRNIAGNIIAYHKCNIDPVSSIDVAFLPSGLYVIEFLTGDQYWNSKFIVK